MSLQTITRKRALNWLLIVSLLLLCVNSFAETKHPQPLRPDQAFILNTTIKSAQEIVATWDIAPGYYLYRQRFQFESTPNVVANVVYPKAEIKLDPNNRQYEVYSGKLSIPVLLKTSPQHINLRVDYQGCSSQGFCYPPMHKIMTLNLTAAPASDSLSTGGTTSFTSLLTDQNSIAAMLGSQHFMLLLMLFVGIGLLLSFTPCVLPMIPILTSIIAGQGQSLSTRKAFFLSSTYVLGTAITYAFAGLAAAWLGSSLQVWLQKPWIIAASAMLFVLLAFSLFGIFELRLPRRFQHHIHFLSNKQKGGTYVGVFMMGMLSTLIVSPCVTAPLVGVLMYISQTGDLVLGASALFAMGIGMGIPLLLIGTSAGRWLPKSGAWMQAVKYLFGVLMLAMAIWLVSRIANALIVYFLSGTLLIGAAIFLSLHLPRLIGRHRLNRGLGFIVGVSGMLIMVGGINISANPLQHFNAMTAAQKFIIVRNESDLNKQLLIAQSKHQPVILDFYADWCESCVSMDNNVFKLPDVQKMLGHFVLLRADLSENTQADEMLLKRYDVIAPPTVVFFDNQGREINGERIVGEVNAKEFVARLTDLRANNLSREE